MDRWTERELSAMKAGGNANLHRFLEKYGLTDASIKIKYETVACQYYRAKVRSALLSVLS